MATASVKQDFHYSKVSLWCAWLSNDSLQASHTYLHLSSLFVFLKVKRQQDVEKKKKLKKIDWLKKM